ncbi:MAG: N-acetylmuramoyl-L-alanine amidase [Dehalococcoidia bacterium]|nr:N-acetylmuramoyl-L-alanine amidase [Dehalococcoidia bacterium]
MAPFTELRLQPAVSAGSGLKGPRRPAGDGHCGPPEPELRVRAQREIPDTARAQRPLRRAAGWTHHPVCRRGRRGLPRARRQPRRALPLAAADSLGKYGVTVVNQMSIGIEHEGFSGRPPTDRQLAASIALHRYLAQQHGIPADAAHIVGHGQLDRMQRTACPGSRFPLDRIIAAVKEVALGVA